MEPRWLGWTLVRFRTIRLTTPRRCVGLRLGHRGRYRTRDATRSVMGRNFVRVDGRLWHTGTLETSGQKHWCVRTLRVPSCLSRVLWLTLQLWFIRTGKVQRPRFDLCGGYMYCMLPMPCRLLTHCRVMALWVWTTLLTRPSRARLTVVPTLSTPVPSLTALIRVLLATLKPFSWLIVCPAVRLCETTVLFLKAPNIPAVRRSSIDTLFYRRIELFVLSIVKVRVVLQTMGTLQCCERLRNVVML